MNNKKTKDAKINLIPIPEIVRVNEARKVEGMPAIPDDAALNATLQAMGITECLGKKYPWA
jgi:hypothetical protein